MPNSLRGICFLVLPVFIAFFSHAQPANDNCTNAVDITSNLNSGSCNTYAMGGATDDLEGSCNNNFCPGGPNNNPNENVWFSFTTSTPGNVTITINGYSWGTPNYDPIVTLFSACNGGSEVGCSNANGDGTNNDSQKTVTFTGLATGTTYYISIDPPCSDTGSFCLQVDYIDPSHCTNGVMDADETGIDCGGAVCSACHCTNGVMDADETGIDCGGADCSPCGTCTDNEDCGSAATLTFSGGPDTLSACITDCNTGASTESWNFVGGCPNTTNTETVYYTFTTADPYIDIIFSSTSISEPQLVLLTSDCSQYYTNGCVVGSGGSASITNYLAGTGNTYSLMITSQSGETGNFDLCIYNYGIDAACAVDDTLIATPPPDTTGGYAQGIYAPGTTVEFCYTINQYSKVNCQWLHGIVPFIGSGWDLSSFTVTQAPVSADGDGNWGWFSATTGTAVTYNFNGTFYNTGDTINGFGGWFYLNDCNSICPTHNGDPNLSYGDGMCGGPCQCDIDGSGYTWSVCFELTTPDSCAGGADFSVGIQTFADGETGGYSETGCDVDPIQYPTFPYPTSLCPECNIETVSITHLDCFGDNDGAVSITMDTSGIKPYTYSWNTNPVQTDSAITGLVAGSYSVTVTDSIGCIDSITATVTEPALLTANITDSAMVLCFGDNDGTATVTPGGGVTPHSYLWNDGSSQTTPVATGLTGGTYDVTVTDSNNCTITASVSITEPSAALSVSITGSTNILCNGDATGTASTSTSGGTSPYIFLWDDAMAQINPNATGLTAGSYLISVTDNNGCTDTVSVTITEPSALVLSITSSSDANCGQPDGSATASASGAIPPYAYLWNDPSAQTNATATGLGAGNYTVVVTEGNGCTDSISVNINNLGGGTASITDSTNILCNGDATGSATVTPVGGALPITYSWDDPMSQTDSSATGLPVGSYTATVTDNAGCVSLATVNITEPPAINITATNLADVLCNGGNDGSVTASTSGGVSPYTFAWNDPMSQTDSIAIGLMAGTYSVMVTDNNGCLDSLQATISEPPLLSVSITDSVQVDCNGNSSGTATGTPGGGTLPYTYLWDDPMAQTDSSAMGLPAGTYTLNITDGNGCTTSTATTISEPALLSLSITTTDASCFGYADGSIVANITGGTTNYSYSWSNGANNNNTVSLQDSITGLTAGPYGVTISDNNGCMDSTNTTVGEPIEVSISLSADSNVTCNGGTDGVATISIIQGTVPFNYNWSNGNSTLLSPDTFNTITGLSAGIYTVTISDLSGCITIDSIAITEPTLLNLTTTTNNDVTCNGGIDGSGKTNTKGSGTSPYDFVWSNGDSTMASSTNTNDVLGLSAGTHYITVTDANGCSAVDTIIILEPSALVLNTGVLDANCGQSNGLANVDVTGGIFPYLYQWDDSLLQTTDTAFNIPSGTYTIVVTDSAGCIDTGFAAVSDQGGATLSLDSLADISCNGANDGYIHLTTTGGGAPYDFIWNTADTTEDLNNIAGGAYSISVTDNAGCITVYDTTLNEPTVLSAILTGSDVSCNGINDGQVLATANGGTTPYTYLWNDPGAQSNANAISLAGGSYTLTLTDSNGCLFTDSFSIAEPSALVLTPSSVQATCGAANGNASVAVSGGTSPYTLQWNDLLAQTTDTAFGLGAGLYTVVVTDSGGCMDSIAVTVTNSGSASIVVDSITDVSCNGGSDGTISITVTGGTAPYTYLWSTADTTKDLSGVGGGSISLTLTDGAGCISLLDTSITEPSAITAIITGTNPSCNGTGDGQVMAAAIGGTGSLTYQWDDPSNQTTAMATGLGAGTYTINITDDNGCSFTDSITLTDPPALVLSTNTTVASCGGVDGTAQVFVAGGTSPYGYLWNDPAGQTNDIATGLGAGTYWVLVTDNNGCLDSSSVTITTTTLTAVAGPDTSLCIGDAVQLYAGGGDSYLWIPATGLNDPNAHDPIASPSVSTTYAVAVSAAGCPDDTAYASVTVNPLPNAYAGQDTIIPSGGSVNLSGSGGTIFTWTPSDGLSCDNCQNPIATPEATTTYILSVTDDLGCMGYDTIRIEIDDKTVVFFPEIFSIGATNFENKWAYIQGKGIENIIEFYVFDRWGKKVFENHNFQANDRSLGWDGTHKGEVMNPGVFVYYFKLQFYNGAEYFQSGDITLVH